MARRGGAGMHWQKVLIGGSIASAVFILLIAVSGFFLSRYLLARAGPRNLKAPSYLETPSIVTGSDVLLKTIVFEDSRLGSITDISEGDLDPSPGVEIGIAGTRGATLLDENMTTKLSVMFSGRMAHVDIIDADGDNICEYMNRGGMGWSDASLIDHDGNTIWTYGGMPGVDDMASGDIDGDGRKEFVVGFNGGGGVRLLDENGKKTWKKPDGNVWHVEMVDTDRDGDPEIVHSNASGRMTVRDADGEILRRTRLGPYFSKFSLCKWPSKKGRLYALLSEENVIWLFDFDGKAAARLPAPRCGRLGHARGTSVKIKTGQPEYLAVIVEFRHWNRAILYVYDSKKRLVYQEILPEVCASIAAISGNNTRAETLLVGGSGRVWEYRLNTSDDAG
jgi:hypothetical protein